MVIIYRLFLCVELTEGGLKRDAAGEEKLFKWRDQFETSKKCHESFLLFNILFILIQ